MTYSVRSIRKRLLEVMSRAELVTLTAPHYDSEKRGKSPLIDYMLDNWQEEYDTAILDVVARAIPPNRLKLK